MAPLSPRLQMIVDALPLLPGMRVLEIGCGPGAAARAVAGRVEFVLGIDRSAKAIRLATEASVGEISQGVLDFRQAAAEDFELLEDEKPFDLAFAVRVGAFDGRHPDAGEQARQRLKKALKPGAPFYIDSGDPLLRIRLDD
jgi:cyclopropane fatty-acyl-phospholipid synthase-like methyltransferase